MLKSRLLKENDYETLLEWWDFWKWENPPTKEILPQNGVGGIMVTNNGVDICAGFLYTTNSKVAWLEFVVSSPTYKEKDRKEAKRILVNDICYIAKNLGFTSIFTCVQDKFLIKVLQDCGFSSDKPKSVEMAKRL
jgi:hypothetical protein